MLCAQLECCKTHPDDHMHPLFKELSVAEIVEELCHQLEAFWHNEYPFNTPVKDGNPLVWWRCFGDHNHAHVLSVSIISVLVVHAC